MKKWWLFILALVLLSSVVCAEKTMVVDFVNDYAGIVDAEHKAKIEQVLKVISDSGKAEFAIVTVKNTGGKDIESYSLDLVQNRLGDKEKNNGLLLLVSIEDKAYRFEVGRGLEYMLNDAKVGRIGRKYIVPNFQNRQYGKGILEASLAVESILLNKTESRFYVIDQPEYRFNPLWFFISFFLFFSVMSWITRLLFSKRKKDRYFGAALTALWLFGGHGGRGGFGGGGFGGFGGGGFGGGGASGGW